MEVDEHSGDSTPRALLERARALAATHEDDAALDLLRRNRGRWKQVPPAYELLLGRLLLASGEVAAAADHLLLARDGLNGVLQPGARRDLAMSLLATGRVEEAGRELRAVLSEGQEGSRPAWVARPACIAAMDAYDHAPATLDAGKPTPYRLIAQAEMLAEANDAASGVSLLAAHRGDWDSVPATYETTRARLEALQRDWQAEVARLTASHTACTGEVPASLNLSLGAALLETHQPLAAGRALDLARETGATIDRLNWRIAIDMHRRAQGDAAGFDTNFGREATLVDEERRLAYIAIPKNACTELKAVFILNSRHREAFLASHVTIHDFCSNLGTTVPRGVILQQDFVRFTVLRDPLRRLVSAYLNKIVRGRRNRLQYLRLPLAHTIRAAQHLAGVPYDPVRSITFEEFVRFLARADDTELNLHWMPQVRFTGRDLSLYEHVGRVERLSETFDFLARRFGCVTETTIGSKRIGGLRRLTRYSSQSPLTEPYRALPRALDAVEDQVPDYAHFYSPELRRIVAERYAEDMSLYASVADGGGAKLLQPA